MSALARRSAMLRSSGATSAQPPIADRTHAVISPTTVRTVCAYSLSFPQRTAAAEIWTDLTSSISSWYARNEQRVSLPAGWERGTDARVSPLHGHALDCSVTSVAGVHGVLRELRWVYPDDRDGSLLWTIEAATLPGDGANFILLLRIASGGFELRPALFELRTPRVIRHVVARGDAHIGAHRLESEARRIEADAVSDLATLLLSESRRHPIIVISPEAMTDDVLSVDPDLIAATVAGLGSVYVLGSRWAGFALTDEVGKRLSCYNGAVRIYWPRFELDADPFAHPLWLPPQIDDLGGADGFSKMLMRMLAGVASFRYVEPQPVRTFRAQIEDSRIGTRRADHEHAGNAELFDDYVRLETQARELRERLDAMVEENAALKTQLASRWTASDDHVEHRDVASDDSDQLTDVLGAVGEAQRRTTNLVIMREAFDSARASPFRQPSKVLSALLAIDDVARLWAKQRADGEKLGARRDLFRQRGFDYKEDISQTAEGKWGTDYTYIYDGRRVLFAPHITIGAKSPDRCLSIHMHWDEERHVVAIGHVGRHKTNTKT